MTSNKRYPKIAIRSKNELAKRISHTKLPYNKALQLINDVLKDYDKLWKDHPTISQPEKGKWVRDASYTKLGKLLKLINEQVLRPYDNLLPDFIFGGVSGKNHKKAVEHLLGRSRKRVILKLDVTRFFEQIQYDRVYHFYRDKAGCGEYAARLLADLSCVYYGAKGQPENYKTIARGFPTSPRLAIWCNLDIFLKIDWLAKKKLKGHDARVAIYVDDIAITASHVGIEEMTRLYPSIKNILNSDKNQQLPLNDSKTKIIRHDGSTYDIAGNFEGKWGFEHLGLQMNRNSVTLGNKTRWKMAELIELNKKHKGKNKDIKRRRKSLLIYKSYVGRKDRGEVSR